MNDLGITAFAAIGVQVVCCILILWAFRPKGSAIRYSVISAAVVIAIASMLVEHALGSLLKEGTLVFSWTLLALIAHRLGGLKLPAALAAIPCLFATQMAWAVFQDSQVESREEKEARLLTQGFEDEAASSIPTWAEDVLYSRLDLRLLSARNFIRERFLPPALPAGETEDASPLSPSEVVAAIAPSPTLTVEPKLEPAENVVPGPGTEAAPELPLAGLEQDPEGLQPQNVEDSEEEAGMSGEEFAGLFGPSNSSEPEPVESPAEKTEPSFSPVITGRNFVKQGNLIGSQELSQMVRVKNRSTSKEVPAPNYEVSAVSSGSYSTYAIVDGGMVQLGSTIPAPKDSKARMWRLVKVSQKELLWQPIL